MKHARRAGGRWRLLAHRLNPQGRLVLPGMYGPVYGPPIDIHAEDYGPCEFDELTVGRWLHVEQMNVGFWWMSVGGVVIDVYADRDGRPKRVTVYGPGDYDNPVDGCNYEICWTAE